MLDNLCNNILIPVYGIVKYIFINAIVICVMLLIVHEVMRIAAAEQYATANNAAYCTAAKDPVMCTELHKVKRK